jgi:hypothetical protein
MKNETPRLERRLVQARNAILYSAVTLGIVSAAALEDIIPFIAVVPFALSLGKALWTAGRGQGPQKIAHVGYSEAVFSTIFAVLVIVAFWPST